MNKKRMQFFVVTLVVFALMYVPTVQALIIINNGGAITITSGGTTATIETSESVGMSSWFVDGVDQFGGTNPNAVSDFKGGFQSFYFRLGSGTYSDHEYAVQDLDVSNIAIETEDVAILESTYTDGSRIEITITYTLVGIEGSGHADMGEEIKVKNLTDNPLSISLFEFTRFTLGGDGSDDTLRLIPNVSAAFEQFDSTSVSSETITGQPSPSHFEIGSNGSILKQLEDLYVTETLDDFNHTESDNPEFAWQWNVTLDGSELGILKDKAIGVSAASVTPEPTSLLLFGFALAGIVSFSWSQRKNRRT